MKKFELNCASLIQRTRHFSTTTTRPLSMRKKDFAHLTFATFLLESLNKILLLTLRNMVSSTMLDLTFHIIQYFKLLQSPFKILSPLIPLCVANGVSLYWANVSESSLQDSTEPNTNTDLNILLFLKTYHVVLRHSTL